MLLHWKDWDLIWKNIRNTLAKYCIAINWKQIFKFEGICGFSDSNLNDDKCWETQVIKKKSSLRRIFSSSVKYGMKRQIKRGVVGEKVCVYYSNYHIHHPQCHWCLSCLSCVSCLSFSYSSVTITTVIIVVTDIIIIMMIS